MSKIENPLKALSCEEVLKSLQEFVEARLGGDELLLRKIAAHLKRSTTYGKCGCAEEFNRKLRKKSDWVHHSPPT